MPIVNYSQQAFRGLTRLSDAKRQIVRVAVDRFVTAEAGADSLSDDDSGRGQELPGGLMAHQLEGGVRLVSRRSGDMLIILGIISEKVPEERRDRRGTGHGVLEAKELNHGTTIH